ncbi:MAG: hypothetical protein RLO01_13455 [Thalassobaculaceae bacterium]
MNIEAGTATKEWDLVLALRSPFVLAEGGTSSTAVDRTLARNADGKIIVQGTQIRGILRDVAETLRDRTDLLKAAGEKLEGDPVAALFGSASGSGASGEKSGLASLESWRVDNVPLRRRFEIGDLVAVTEEPEPAAGAEGVFTRISIDPALGAAREGHLQVIEMPFPPGQEVEFRGRVTVRGQAAADCLETVLEKARSMIVAVGAHKSAGFGRVVSLELQEPESDETPSDATASDARVIDVDFKIDRPFLVNAIKLSDNVSKGSEIIPGGALKGAVAAHLQAAAGKMRPEMMELLAETVFGPAFPLGEDAGQGLLVGSVPPLSLVHLGHGESADVKDVLLCPDPQAAMEAATGEAPITLKADWKSADAARVAARIGLKRPKLATQSRTRTKIDYNSGTAEDGGDGEGGQLFAQLLVVPNRNVIWRTRLVAPEGREAAWRELQRALIGDISGLGKTRAVATASRIAPATLPSAPEPVRKTPEGACWAVTLQSDALLNDMAALRRDRDLRADYARYWAGLGFELDNFLAEQRLAGGYVALRYPQHDDRYEPYLLTVAGSVFLIRESAPGTGAAKLAELLRDGLPPNAAIGKRSWEECPYIAENGYGQIALEHRLHKELRLPGGKGD